MDSLLQQALQLVAASVTSYESYYCLQVMYNEIDDYPEFDELENISFEKFKQLISKLMDMEYVEVKEINGKLHVRLCKKSRESGILVYWDN